MKLFDISDVLSATTGRLVSTRHMEGIHAIYNFLTDDELYTHQLIRAEKECEPWLRAQYPKLMKDSPEMAELLKALDDILVSATKSERSAICDEWVNQAQAKFSLPRMIPLHAMGEDMHTRIDPVEELRAMVGDDKVIVIEAEQP